MFDLYLKDKINMLMPFCVQSEELKLLKNTEIIIHIIFPK